MKFLVSPALLLALATLFWGGNFVIGRAVVAEIPPIGLSIWRWLIALAVLLPFTAGPLWRDRKALLAHWRIIVILGVTGIGAFHTCVYVALIDTSAVSAALFMALTPLMIPLFAYAIDRERPTGRRLVGVVISLLGAVVLVTRGDPAVLVTLTVNRGDGLMLCAAALWALYSVLLRHRPTGVPSLSLLTALTVTGTLSLLPAYAWELANHGGFAITGASVATIAYLAVCASLLAYIFWNRGVTEIGAARGGHFMHLVPVFASALAILFLDETVEGFHLAGASLVILGIAAATERSAPA